MGVTGLAEIGRRLLAMSAKVAKDGFRSLIDLARAAPAVVDRHGRPIVVEMAVEELEKLTGDMVSPSQEKGVD